MSIDIDKVKCNLRISIDNRFTEGVNKPEIEEAINFINQQQKEIRIELIVVTNDRDVKKGMNTGYKQLLKDAGIWK